MVLVSGPLHQQSDGVVVSAGFQPCDMRRGRRAKKKQWQERDIVYKTKIENKAGVGSGTGV